ncbi:hypothetical protein [Bradyrhizobium sp. McL0616]|uniref:hypothetical protein n=1 Tax=Bradyrhizobium sp. McL0616 TaxID=3415674 RepID=UPI003CE8EED3
MTQPYRRLASMAATVAGLASVSSDVRQQRVAHRQDRERQQRLAEAQADVEAAHRALARVRDTAAEEAALAEAQKRLVEIEREIAKA